MPLHRASDSTPINQRQATKIYITSFARKHLNEINEKSSAHMPTTMICIVCRKFLYCRPSCNNVSLFHILCTLSASSPRNVCRNACRWLNASKPLIYGLKCCFSNIYGNWAVDSASSAFKIMINANLQWLVNWTHLSWWLNFCISHAPNDISHLEKCHSCHDFRQVFHSKYCSLSSNRLKCGCSASVIQRYTPARQLHA